MNYRLKAAIHQVLSHLPRGEQLNYLLQRYLTRSLPANDTTFFDRVAHAGRHFTAFRTALPACDPAQAHFFEFGAGWDLIVPLTLAGLGVRRQTVIDIRPNMHLSLVQDTLERLRRHEAEIRAQLGHHFTAPAGDVRTLADLKSVYGIAWRAPCDARQTGLPAGSIDVITNTVTLEHIPPDDIAAILVECARLLRPGGLLSCVVDPKDHYAYSDPHIGYFHFLSIPDRQWAWYNPALHYQNRLRYPEYLRLFAASGLALVVQDITAARVEDLLNLQRMPLAAHFQGMAPADLGIRLFHVLLQKPV